MKIGIVYPQTELGGDPESVRRFGLAVEQLGFDHLLAYDHVVGAVHEDRTPPLWGPYTDQHPFHDPFVMFAYLAAITTRIELVTGVLILPQRQTVLVAKQCADLDLLSGGRLRLGVGVGWNHVEYDALGQDFTTRGARADEQIGFLRRLWSEPLVSFSGRFDHIDRGNILPRPGRAIPIWVGGFGGAAFRRASRMADGFIYAGGVERAASSVPSLLAAVEASGRSPEAFGLDLVTNRDRSADQLAPMVEAWRAAGGTHLSIVTMGMGLDSVEAHLDYLDVVRDRLSSVR